MFPRLTELHRLCALITLLAIGVQTYLAGASTFGLATIGWHLDFSWVVLLLGIALLLLAVFGGLSRRTVVYSGLAPLLTFLQGVLVDLPRSSLAWRSIVALHVFNTLLIFYVVYQAKSSEQKIVQKSIYVASQD